MSRSKAMLVGCPDCGAPRLLPCMGKRGPRSAVHSGRMEASRAKRPAPIARASKAGWVYFIGNPNSDQVKIGWTGGDPWDRLKALQTGNGSELMVLAKFEGTQRDEKAAHRHFAEQRLTGEWFKVNDELDSLIRDLASRAE